MRRSLALLLLAVPLFSIDACTPKGGDSCTGKAEACSSDKEMVVCKHDRYMPIPCEGPKGCKVDKDKALCDFSGNKTGSKCDETLLGKRQCRSDGKSVVGCRNEKFTVAECRGPNGCKNKDNGQADCDTSIAKAGDDCDRGYVTKPACDADGKQLLECGKDGKFGFFRYCRGPKGCTSKNGEAECDNSVTQAGDPCEPPAEGNKYGHKELCTPDNIGLNLCDGQKVFEKPCLGPLHCAMKDTGPACDQSSPVDGATCETKGQLACQKPGEHDKGKLLECDGKKFKVSKTCKIECKFTRPDKYECIDDAPKK